MTPSDYDPFDERAEAGRKGDKSTGDGAEREKSNSAGSDEPPRKATDDDAELARLARLPTIEYERARADAAKRLGCRAAMLDRLVGAKRAELGLDRDDGKQGRPIEFAIPEPWPDPVDGSALLDDLAAALGRYVVMSDHQRAAVALWVMHAYLLDWLMISPRLAIRSAVKGSGKTTLIDVLARLVPRALLAASVTPSAIFRVIAAHRPTLLIDEADTLFHDGDETLRGVLNAGHRKGGAVLRSVGDDFEPRSFPCYAAIAIALIGQLPGTLADRSIDIVLARRRPSETITPFRLDQTDHLDVLARRIARWAMDNGERLTRDPDMPPGLHNRAADNWRPLLMVAEACAEAWPETAQKAAAALAGGDIDEVSRTELLLSDIRDIFAAPQLDEITSAALIERLCAIVPRPWAEFGKSGKPITQNKLARLLKPLGIGPGLIGNDRLHGYKQEGFAEAFERYLSPLPPFSNRSSAQTSEKLGNSELSQPLTPKPDERFEKSGNAQSSCDLSGRAVWKGGSSELCAAYEVLSPARPGQRCSICDGSIGVKRIRLGGKERAWHPACADRYCAAIPAGTPEDIVATTRRAGASFDLSEDGSGFVPNLTRMSDRAASNAILDAVAANRDAILDLLRREAGSR
jgi:putative DNA primase/helicase